MEKIYFLQLQSVSFKKFKSFLDSLDEERKTWSLDLQNFKNEKEFYDKMTNCILAMSKDKITGLACMYVDSKYKLAEFSFVVKKEYHSMGIGTKMLAFLETQLREQGFNDYTLTAKHFKNNIASMVVFNKLGWNIDIQNGQWDFLFRSKKLN